MYKKCCCRQIFWSKYKEGYEAEGDYENMESKINAAQHVEDIHELAASFHSLYHILTFKTINLRFHRFITEL